MVGLYIRVYVAYEACVYSQFPTKERRSDSWLPRQGVWSAGGGIPPAGVVRYFMARNPSKHIDFMMVIMSTNPARFMRSKFPWVEKGSRTPLRLRCLPRISSSLNSLSTLNSM